jgi:hypothetical protein
VVRNGHHRPTAPGAEKAVPGSRDPLHRPARRLVSLVEDFSRQHDVPIMELWTDTRFENAHGLYAHLGYTKTDETRELDDKSNTVEY